jgi:hypothetical protein
MRLVGYQDAATATHFIDSPQTLQGSMNDRNPRGPVPVVDLGFPLCAHCCRTDPGRDCQHPHCKRAKDGMAGNVTELAIAPAVILAPWICCPRDGR